MNDAIKDQATICATIDEIIAAFNSGTTDEKRAHEIRAVELWRNETAAEVEATDG